MSKIHQQVRLSDFIKCNIEIILKEWDKFAKTISKSLDQKGLRDHAREMLLVVAEDLCHSQTKKQQSDKSKGLTDNMDKASEEHGMDRLQAGFSIDDTVSEFRALRASVVSLWTSQKDIQLSHFEDLIRFNEAIDQAIAESLCSYTNEKDQQTRLLETIMEAFPDQVYVLDAKGKFTYANTATTKLYGMTKESIIGKTYKELAIPLSKALEKNWKTVLDTKKSYRSELSYFNQQAEKRLEYILSPVLGEDKTVESTVAIARDVTVRSAAENLSWHNANFDSLTALPNRRLFHERLESDITHAKKTGESIALLFIDLDKFKEVNDTLGHEYGDDLLKQVATRINSCVNSNSTVARLGGDEFTAIITDNMQKVKTITKKIVQILDKPFMLGKKEVNISGSVGVTVFPQDANTMEGLIKNADKAMYKAKHAGRNQFQFFNEIV